MARATEAPSSPPAPPRSARWLLAVPATAPQVLAVVAIAVLGSSDAGFAPTRWYPAAIFLTALLALCAFLLPRRSAVPAPVLLALGAMAALTAWSYLSIVWADDPGIAWAGSNRTLLFLVCLALFALWRQRGRHAAAVLGLWTAWVIGLAIVTLIRVDTTANLDPLFIGDRLASIAGYPNATAAALMMGFFPALVLAGRREIPWWLRGLAAGGAVVCVDVALLAQSRGSAYSIPIVLLILFIAVPGRLRTLAVLAAAGIGIALTAPGILSDLDDARASGLNAGAFDGLGAMVGIGAAATAVMVAIGAFVDSRTDVLAETAQRARRAVGAVVIALAVVSAVAALVIAGDPIGRAADAWDSFKGGYTEQQLKAEGTRLASGLGSNRYDFFRVALDQFAAAPITGAGAENFLEDYLQEGRSAETPRYPHSVIFRTLGQLGLVGAALLLVVLGAAVAALWRALRQADAMAGAVAGAAAIVFVYWFVHGSFDWFWEYGGLGASAFAMLGLALALVPRADRPDARPFAAGRRGLVAIPVLAVAACTLVAPWLAERWVDEASATWSRSPGEAFDLLDRAAAANPLSSRPYLAAGVIAVRVDDLPRAREEFRNALEREPRSYYAALELGAIASEFGRREEALDWLERARQASPRDPIVRRAIARVRAGGRVTAAEINAAILKRARGLVS